MLMTALILFGLVSFRELGVSQLPDVDFPVVTVSLRYPGAAPEVLESSVVDPVEDAVTSIQGVTRVSSSSLSGSATVTVEFDIERDVDLALQDVQAKVEQARRELPQDIEAPVITKTNPEDQPILWLALQAEGIPVAELARYIHGTLKGQFATVPGVGDIRLGGYQEPNLRVWIDPKKLRPYALTMSDVIQAVRTEHLEPPSGTVEFGESELAVRTLGEAESVKAFQNIYLMSRGGQPNYEPIPIRNFARIEEGTEDIRRIARSNGIPTIGLGIQKQRGANAVAVAEGVIKRMEEVRKTLPAGMTLNVRNDTTRFIRESVDELVFTLILAAVLTSLLCWAFLGTWSATLNVILAIPTSVIGAFISLWLLGFTLNVFTLLALSLSIGIVVDDAIMVLENITRRRQSGEGKVRAALLGARQITFAATAATISILAIFLPVVFMKGVVGRYFLQFGVTLSVAVLLSLIEALTITPMRSALFLDVKERRTRIGKAIEWSIARSRDRYAGILVIALRHRLAVIVAAFAVFGASLFSLQWLNREFLPAEDRSQFLLRVKLPVHVSLQTTNKSVREMEQALLKHPAVESYFASVGGFAGQVNEAFLFVNLKPKSERKESQEEVMQWARENFGNDGGVKVGRQVIAQGLEARGFTASRGFPVEFTLTGEKWERMSELAATIEKRMLDSGQVVDIHTDTDPGAPELAIVPERNRAEQRGVPVSTIAETVSAAFGGVVAGRYTEAGRRYEVRVKAVEKPGVAPRERLADLDVRNNRGELVPILDVVKLERREAPRVLNRLNRERAITFFANVIPGKSQAAALDLVRAIGADLPQGYRLQVSGTAEVFQESFAGLIFALALGIAVAYMVLATQFNSFADPVTILVALPFSVTGAFLALLAAGQSLNIYSMIGLLLLMGIVKKNSILLVEFTNQVRDGVGFSSIQAALLQACPVRFRPIVMTSIATIAAAIPAAIAFGPGAEVRRPMAITIIGGVIFSTLLTLVVVPCVYSLISRKERKRVEERDFSDQAERKRIA